MKRSVQRLVCSVSLFVLLHYCTAVSQSVSGLNNVLSLLKGVVQILKMRISTNFFLRSKFTHDDPILILYNSINSFSVHFPHIFFMIETYRM